MSVVTIKVKGFYHYRKLWAKCNAVHTLIHSFTRNPRFSIYVGQFNRLSKWWQFIFWVLNYISSNLPTLQSGFHCSDAVTWKSPQNLQGTHTHIHTSDRTCNHSKGRALWCEGTLWSTFPISPKTCGSVSHSRQHTMFFLYSK